VWSSVVPGGAGSLHGETVGIVGLGNIGSAFARRIAAFETTLIAHDPYVDDRHFAALGVERVSLETLAARSDYVSVHTLLNAETRHLIGDAFFRRMKPSALLINTSRGPVVDEAALIRALDAKRLAGAALDVFETEPLPTGHPFYALDNVVVSPHCADNTPGWLEAAMRAFLGNLDRFRRGERLLNVVDKRLGY
jgi:phosphoglycerate dehydrogenase-like enzyme